MIQINYKKIIGVSPSFTANTKRACPRAGSRPILEIALSAPGLLHRSKPVREYLGR